MRGGITGGMTFLGGSLHTLPFLVPELHLALVVAYIVVAVELVLIAGIRYRFLATRVVALYATSGRWRCADLRQCLMMATYGSSESKPRARARATA